MVATALLALLICHAAAASMLSTVGTSPWSDAWTNSFLAGTTWSMKLNVGREPNTRMPEGVGEVWRAPPSLVDAS